MAVLRTLEEVLIRTLASYGIAASRREGWTGVWCERGKIAQMGIRVSRWVTRHGFALNVRPELSPFRAIVPCSDPAGDVTSMAEQLDEVPSVEEVGRVVSRELARGFELELSVEIVAAVSPEGRGA